MPSERYYLPENYNVHDRKTMSGAEFHHLAHVMRTRKGEKVELVNGEGALAVASVIDLRKDHAILIVENVTEQKKQETKIILAQALPKQNRLEFVLEKGTELGVDEFWLFPGDTSSKKEIYPSQLERAQAVTIAAMKQCGRFTLPSVIIKPQLSDWPHFASTAFFGDVDTTAIAFSRAWEKSAQALPIIFVTGPESGLTDGEVNELKLKGACSVKLHEHILRTDTASITAISLISHWLMN